MDTPIALLRSTGAKIVGNVVRGLVPVPLSVGFSETEGIFVAGLNPNDITGRIRIADNFIEMSTGDFTNGMQLDETSADMKSPAIL